MEEDFIVKIVKKSTVEDKARKNRNAMESRDKRAKLVALRINKAKAEDDDEENDEEDDEWESDDDDENDGEYDGEPCPLLNICRVKFNRVLGLINFSFSLRRKQSGS